MGGAAGGCGRHAPLIALGPAFLVAAASSSATEALPARPLNSPPLKYPAENEVICGPGGPRPRQLPPPGSAAAAAPAAARDPPATGWP